MGLYHAAEMKLEALAKESENGIDISDSGRSMSLPGSKERVLKFELQMYKMRDGEYCIDIQVCNRGAHDFPFIKSTLALGPLRMSALHCGMVPQPWLENMYSVCLMPLSVVV